MGIQALLYPGWGGGVKWYSTGRRIWQHQPNFIMLSDLTSWTLIRKQNIYLYNNVHHNIIYNSKENKIKIIFIKWQNG